MSAESFPSPPRNYEGQHAPLKNPNWFGRKLGSLGLMQYNADMGKKGTVNNDPHTEQMIRGSREARELVRNDGTKTYVVHSGNVETAHSAMEHGLRFNGNYFDSSKPDLVETGLMLAGPGERAAQQRNVDYLSYKYEGHADDRLPNNAKLVFEFDQPNPGTSIKTNPFEGTFLAHADGVNIKQAESSGKHGEGAFVLPAERYKGYFDVESGAFVPNPNFVPSNPSTTPVAPPVPN